MANTVRMSSELVGQELGGRYKLEGKIGSGGFAIVYRAKDTRIGKYVAVKVLDREKVRSVRDIGRFRNEAAIAAAIDDDHIVKVTDYGEEEGRFYFVMELLRGHSLRQMLVLTERFSWQRACAVGVQVCHALEHAHSYHIIHRDIKPENMFLETRRGGVEHVKLLDLGIAKVSHEGGWDGLAQNLSQTGDFVGSPSYMSPEQAKGPRHCDHRVDIYALGVVLFELVTGDVPFRGNTAWETVLMHVECPVPPMAKRAPGVEIPAEFEAIVLRALAKDPDKRYATVAEMGEALQALLVGVEVPPPVENSQLMIIPSPSALPASMSSSESARSAEPVTHRLPDRPGRTPEAASAPMMAPELESPRSSAEAPAPARASAPSSAEASAPARTPATAFVSVEAPAPARVPANEVLSAEAQVPARVPANEFPSAEAPTSARTPASGLARSSAVAPSPTGALARSSAEAPAPARTPESGLARSSAEAPAPARRRESGLARSSAEAPAPARTPASAVGQSSAEASARAQPPAEARVLADERAHAPVAASDSVHSREPSSGQLSEAALNPSHARDVEPARASNAMSAEGQARHAEVARGSKATSVERPTPDAAPAPTQETAPAAVGAQETPAAELGAQEAAATPAVAAPVHGMMPLPLRLRTRFLLGYMMVASMVAMCSIGTSLAMTIDPEWIDGIRRAREIRMLDRVPREEFVPPRIVSRPPPAPAPEPESPFDRLLLAPDDPPEAAPPEAKKKPTRPVARREEVGELLEVPRRQSMASMARKASVVVKEVCKITPFSPLTEAQYDVVFRVNPTTGAIEKIDIVGEAPPLRQPDCVRDRARAIVINFAGASDLKAEYRHSYAVVR